jgi:cyclic pyranopterin phosphate synthase
MARQRRSKLTHVNARGEARMVDVSGKAPTVRKAVATARITARAEVISALLSGALPKGDALAAARIAGIQAAKRTAELIPLCHPLPLDSAEVDISPAGRGALVVTARIRTTARTGVEMEALTAAALAALTIYDMAKALDKGMVIGPVQLEQKTGGKSGDYRRKLRNRKPPA